MLVYIACTTRNAGIFGFDLHDKCRMLGRDTFVGDHRGNDRANDPTSIFDEIKSGQGCPRPCQGIRMPRWRSHLQP